MSSSLSLYIHIPFCDSICDYCDFFSIPAGNINGGFLDTFLDAVITDLNYQLEYFDVKEIPAIYIGGGTPSVLGKRISVLFDALKKTGFTPVEFTVEANPESAAEEFLDTCREGGVTRISLGVQTFHEPSRKAVNRIGTGLLEKRLALAASYFPDTLSADLITGLPYQDEKIVSDDIKRILDFKPAHISLYSLSVENGTNLEKKIKNKDITLPDFEYSDSLWLAARDSLLKAGFHHYEVSNFALPGKRCLHNIRYWHMEGWLGAGPAASGTVINEKTNSAKRFTYASDIDAYIKNPFIHGADCEELDKPALMRETLLMGYRYCEGPDKEKFKKRFGCDIKDCIPETLSRWKDRNTMLFLNSFLSDAFKEMDKKFTY